MSEDLKNVTRKRHAQDHKPSLSEPLVGLHYHITATSVLELKYMMFTKVLMIVMSAKLKSVFAVMGRTKTDEQMITTFPVISVC